LADRHLEEHDVTREEFEEVVCSPESVYRSRSSGRPIAFGKTSAGRRLACVYDALDEVTLLPATAYDVEE
jgi:hypothetical protein